MSRLTNKAFVLKAAPGVAMTVLVLEREIMSSKAVTVAWQIRKQTGRKLESLTLLLREINDHEVTRKKIKFPRVFFFFVSTPKGK